MTEVIDFNERKNEESEINRIVQNSDNTGNKILASRNHPLIKKHLDQGRIFIESVPKRDIFIYMERVKKVGFTNLDYEKIGIKETEEGVELIPGEYSIFGSTDL